MAVDGQKDPAKCLKCQAVLVTPIVCNECRLVFPPPPGADYFSLLGLPRTYGIDEKKLNAAFRAIARRIHPDRFAAASEDVQKLATRLSAEVNEAYFVLSDPVRRADYLLELSGGPSAAEMREVPGGLLAEIMMLREDISLTRSYGADHELLRHRYCIAARRDEMLRQIAPLAELATDLDEPRRKELRQLLNSMKYFDNLLTELADDPLAVAESATDD